MSVCAVPSTHHMQFTARDKYHVTSTCYCWRHLPNAGVQELDSFKHALPMSEVGEVESDDFYILILQE